MLLFIYIYIYFLLTEYGSEGLVSTKCDVYSYGIMLMEMFTRRRPSDEMFKENLSFKKWISESIPNNLLQVIDPDLLMLYEKSFGEEVDCILGIMEVALNCTRDSPRERKNIDEVLATMIQIKHRLLVRYKEAPTTPEKSLLAKVIV